MSANVRIKRNQERFLQALVIGKSITEAARECGVNERTGRRWLDDPVVQAERERREAEIREKEQAEIEHILTTGYAAVHERVKALDYMARELEKPYVSQETGRTYELRNSPEHLREWRGVLDDIAKELGQRVKKTEITGKDGGAIQVERNPDLAHLTNAELDQLADLLTKAHERQENNGLSSV